MQLAPNIEERHAREAERQAGSQPNPPKPAGANDPETRRMLLLYYANLCVAARTVDPDRAIALPDLYARLLAILPAANAPESIHGALQLPNENFDWIDAYHAELLLVHLRPAEQVFEELDCAVSRYENNLGKSPHFKNDVGSLRQAFDHDPPDPSKIALARAHLERATREIQWAISEKHLKRSIGLEYSIRVRKAVFCTLIIFLIMLGALTLAIQYCPLLACRSYTGLFVAASAGLLGATFSRLVFSSGGFQELPLAAAKDQASHAVIMVRHAVGGIAAIILYFFFEANLVDGVLFPNLSQIGFAGLRFLPSPLPVQDATPITTRMMFAPNADLSKLLVWSFVAGFSELLVASMLKRVMYDSRSEKGGN